MSGAAELEAKHSGGGEEEEEDQGEDAPHYSASCRVPRGGHHGVATAAALEVGARCRCRAASRCWVGGEGVKARQPTPSLPCVDE